MLKTSITFVKQSNTTPMNNLTPLQEIASRIYAALVTASTYTETDGTVRPEYSTEKLLNYAITEARQLLEATKPEPLEWKLLNEKAKTHYSNGGEFCIFEQGGKFKLINELRSNPEEVYQVGLFETLDEAKQFAEFIRTR
jgi:predicted peroxiredoxin